MIGDKPGKTTNGLFWFYHLGANVYRIIALHSGLALVPGDSGGAEDPLVAQNWDSPESRQHWRISRVSEGAYRISSESTSRTLGIDSGQTSAPVSLRRAGAGPGQPWQLEPVVTLE